MRLLILLFLLVPRAAYANAGLPMLAVVWPLSLGAIVPVIAIESWAVQRSLGIQPRRVLGIVTMANLLSTIVGIPLTWLLLVGVEFGLAAAGQALVGARSYPPESIGEVGRIILMAPWLGPFREGGHWIIPVALLTLLGPFFLASAWTEAWLACKFFDAQEPRQVRRAVWTANAVSYALIAVACGAWLAWGLLVHRR